jgi:predicted transcriptional regulator
MPGKTISAYTDEETAKLVEHIARVEQRKPSQIAAAALAFYVRLPIEAHAALRRLEALASPEDLNLMRREVTRAISNASMDAAMERAAPRIHDTYGDGLQTEEEIMAEAVRLTQRRSESRKGSTVSRHEQAADTQAVPRRRRR